MESIQHRDQKFYIGEDLNRPLAELTYVNSGTDKIIIDHTYVSDALAGQGIAKKLLAEAVDWARKNNKKIIPLCSFAKGQMEKKPDYQDMIY